MRKSNYTESASAALLHADIISPSFRPPLEENDFKYDPLNVFFSGPYITASQREFRAGLILNGFKSIIGPQIVDRKQVARETERKWKEMFIRLAILSSNTASDLLADNALNEIIVLAEQRNKELASELLDIDFELVSKHFEFGKIQEELSRLQKLLLDASIKEEEALQIKKDKTEEFDVQAHELEKTWLDLIDLENMSIIKRYPNGVFPGSLIHQGKDMTSLEPGTELYVPITDNGDLSYVKVSMDDNFQITQEAISEDEAPEDLRKSSDFVASDLNERIVCFHNESGEIEFRALYNGHVRELGEQEEKIIRAVMEQNPSAHITLHMSKEDIMQSLENAQHVLKTQGDAYNEWENAYKTHEQLEKDCQCLLDKHDHTELQKDVVEQDINNLYDKRKDIELEQEINSQIKSLKDDPTLQKEFKKYVNNEPVSEEFKTVFKRAVDSLEKQNEIPSIRNIVPPPQFNDDEELVIRPRNINVPRFPSNAP
jgi:hypothetical protein